MNRVWLGLGGNQPGTLAAFSWVKRELQVLLAELRCASLYRTEPQLDGDQEFFLNSAVTGLWNGTAWSLLERLQVLELLAGRTRDPQRPKGPRVLDVDLLWSATTVCDTPRLRLPHPGLAERRFVLQPLVELDPGLTHPATGVPLAELCARLSLQGVERLTETW